MECNMKITYLKICNYKSIEQLEITDIENALILVGKNNTGKTAVIDAILLAMGMRNCAEHEFLDAGKPISISVHIEYSESDIMLLHSRSVLCKVKDYERWLADFQSKIPSYQDGILSFTFIVTPNMATRYSDGFSKHNGGVILEVCLNILISVVADDLDGVLVCADSTVAAQTPELALLGASSCGDGSGLDLGQGQTGDIIGDAQSEALLGLILLQLLEQSEDGGRGSVLAAQAVTAAGQDDIVHAGLTQGSSNIQVQGLAQGAGLLGTIQNCNLLGSLGQDLQQSGGHPGTVQADLDDTDLLALGVQVIDDFVSNVADRAHSDHNTVSIGCAVVVEQIVVGAQLLVDLGHVLLDHCGQCVEEKGSLPYLFHPAGRR